MLRTRALLVLLLLLLPLWRRLTTYLNCVFEWTTKFRKRLKIMASQRLKRLYQQILTLVSARNTKLILPRLVLHSLTAHLSLGFLLPPPRSPVLSWNSTRRRTMMNFGIFIHNKQTATKNDQSPPLFSLALRANFHLKVEQWQPGPARPSLRKLNWTKFDSCVIELQLHSPREMRN